MASPPPIPPSGSLRLKLLNVLTSVQVGLYKMSGGRIWGSMQGVPCLVLTHTGRKTGKERETPLMYLDTGGDIVIVASRGGSPKNPAWWLNLRDAGQGKIQIRNKSWTVRPRLAEGTEREELWPRLVELYPDYDVYAKRTDREIPVIVLEAAGVPVSA